MRAYIPPKVYAKLHADQREQWDKGTVARMLLATGVPYIGPETIPLIVYRINMLQQSDAICKVAQGHPPAEIEGATIVTTQMLQPFTDAAVDGESFRMKDDEAFIKHMHNKLAQFMLPADKLLEWSLKVGQLMKDADEELEE